VSTPLLSFPLLCPDAANHYNPQTGLFDVSYGTAWQLGQLLALQNQSFSTALYNWKKTVQASDVIAEEQALIQAKLLNEPHFEELLSTRMNRLQAPPIPDIVVDWIAQLKLLSGVPFNYLVPDEQMLPLESMRFFYLDLNWVDALIDGAFSIGRSTTGELQKDAVHLPKLKKAVAQKIRTLRRNTSHALLKDSAPSDETVISGFLMRSKVISRWPGLDVNGYSDIKALPDSKCLIYKMIRLADDLLICFFEGDVVKVDIHEPPEQLHFGVEGSPGNFTTSLRAVTSGAYQGLQLGQQLPNVPPDPQISTRSDKQTVNIADTATIILNKLNTDYNQGLSLNINFTAAEFALEMVKGVVQVEFQKNP
jgi:hypothetical protein